MADMTTAPRQLLGRAERYESILRGAARAFARSGFAATSMEDVAAEAGITKLIVYRHFDSKEELYRAVLERISDRLTEEFLSNLNRGERVGVGVRSLLTVAREDPDGFVLLFRHASREPQFADYAREHTERSVHAARIWLENVFDDEMIGEWAAHAAVEMNVEAVLAWLEHGDAQRDEEMIELTSRGLNALRKAWG
jgi:AcrR family transcriptional regulator